MCRCRSATVQLATDLLVGLRERSGCQTRPMLVGINACKVLRRAVLDVLDHPAIQRCQIHKLRNVKGIYRNDFARV